MGTGHDAMSGTCLLVELLEGSWHGVGPWGQYPRTIRFVHWEWRRVLGTENAPSCFHGGVVAAIPELIGLVDPFAIFGRESSLTRSSSSQADLPPSSQRSPLLVSSRPDTSVLYNSFNFTRLILIYISLSVKQQYGW